MQPSAMQDSAQHDSERAARQWDALGAGFGAFDEEGSWNAYYERPATKDLIGDPGGLRVLDAGCGPGILTEWLTTDGAMASDCPPPRSAIRALADADHLAILPAIWTAETTPVREERYMGLLMIAAARLPP
jgi:hypothetical protein